MSTEDKVRVDVRLTKKEKDKLLRIARSKGCKGLTAFLRLLIKAKKIEIEI